MTNCAITDNLLPPSQPETIELAGTPITITCHTNKGKKRRQQLQTLVTLWSAHRESATYRERLAALPSELDLDDTQSYLEAIGEAKERNTPISFEVEELIQLTNRKLAPELVEAIRATIGQKPGSPPPTRLLYDEARKTGRITNLDWAQGIAYFAVPSQFANTPTTLQIPLQWKKPTVARQLAKLLGKDRAKGNEAANATFKVQKLLQALKPDQQQEILSCGGVAFINATLAKQPTASPAEWASLLIEEVKRQQAQNTANVLAKNHPQFFDYLQCFPKARQIQRQIIAYLGPTNSGKTFQALQQLAAAQKGIYLGPLRLLALEKRDELEEMGVPCDLITGEERVLREGARHEARTVEMAAFENDYDVTVIDEIQMVSDKDRAQAWVAAYCGMASPTILLTGAPDAEPAIRILAEHCHDQLEIVPCYRRAELVLEPPIQRLAQLPPKTAIIGFSRNIVLELKALMDQAGKRAAVLYGALSPEIRREQARRLREGEVDYVIATDAIGMGLNLPLDNVAIWELSKYDGVAQRLLVDHEILQIVGRAGRNRNTGHIYCFNPRDYNHLATALKRRNGCVYPEKLKVAPTRQHLETIAEHTKQPTLYHSLEFFEAHIRFSNRPFQPEVNTDTKTLAWLLRDSPLNLVQNYHLACAPVNQRDPNQMRAWQYWVAEMIAGHPCQSMEIQPHQGRYTLETLESQQRIESLYLWLNQRLPQQFPAPETARQNRQALDNAINQRLRARFSSDGLRHKRCCSCGRNLLPSSRYANCRLCHQA